MSMTSLQTRGSSGTDNKPQSAGRPILPGLLYAALFPAIIGSRCPGALYLSQSLKFRAQALVCPLAREPLGAMAARLTTLISDVEINVMRLAHAGR